MSENPSGGITLSNQYVAGLFDGEGCISTSRTFVKGKYEKYPRVRMQISIANTHMGIMNLLTEWFGGGCTDKNGRNVRKAQGLKPCYSWRISGRENMTKFLNYIKDYVIIKKKQLELALVFCDTIREENIGKIPLNKEIHKLRDEIHYGLRELKASGFS
jgi:hypothetical protein